MSSEVVVRDLSKEDLESLLGLYAHLHATDDPRPEGIARIWDEIVRDPSQIYVGAFFGDSLVSACNAAIIPNLTRGGRPYAVVENVVTHAEYRRRGIASTTLGALLARCWERRCYKVMLMSATSRAEIHGFYEAVGFDRESKQAFVITAR
jgi:GNAT superfamily N-acetyltransferase